MQTAAQRRLVHNHILCIYVSWDHLYTRINVVVQEESAASDFFFFYIIIYRFYYDVRYIDRANPPKN